MSPSEDRIPAHGFRGAEERPHKGAHKGALHSISTLLFSPGRASRSGAALRSIEPLEVLQHHLPLSRREPLKFLRRRELKA